MGYLEQLLGVELGLPARFIIAFFTVLVLIGLTAWIVRRVAAGRSGIGLSRSRQQRLAVVDAAQVDAKRRLILVRRDNTEHLILVGGPSDVVVEAQIARGQPRAERPDQHPAQRAGGEQQPRAAKPRAEPPVPPRPARPSPPAQTPPPQSPPPQSTPQQSPPSRSVGPQRFPGAGGPAPAPQPPGAQPAQPAVKRDTGQSAEHGESGDPKLHDMAHRLESALTRPYRPQPPAAEGEQDPARTAAQGASRAPQVDLYDQDRKRNG